MKIFIIGSSGIGKTTISKELEKEYGFKHIKASGWLAEYDIVKENRASYLSEISRQKLKEDPYCVIRYIENELPRHNHCIIDGIRNPFDLSKLIDDDSIIIYLTKTNSEFKSEFEKDGLLAIQEYLGFVSKYLFDIHCINYDEFDGPCYKSLVYIRDVIIEIKSIISKRVNNA